MKYSKFFNLYENRAHLAKQESTSRKGEYAKSEAIYLYSPESKWGKLNEQRTFTQFNKNKKILNSTKCHATYILSGINYLWRMAKLLCQFSFLRSRSLYRFQ
jgi:hypothetical protein